MNAFDPSDNCIQVRGARVHNLRNVDVDLPRDALVVLTGVSGSGKSSLAFDTLFAEGQRRYLESLSAYTRQFLSQLERPDVDSIEGLPPTLCIDQRAGSAQQRSTLATTTEIYDYLRLLYARAGEAHCVSCGRPVAQQSPQVIVERILALEEGRKVMILAPMVRGRKGTHRDVFEKIGKAGFVRARVDGEIIDAADPPRLAKGKPHTIEAVVDRIIVKEGIQPRLQESIELALKQGDGTCLVSDQREQTWHDRLYSAKFACPDCGLSFPDLEPRTFSFNSPYGACPECDGLGSVGENAAECPACAGARLNPFARGVTLSGKAIHEVTAMTVGEADWFCERLLRELGATATEDVVAEAASVGEGSADRQASSLPHGIWTPEGRLAAEKILPDVASRLRYLRHVGLDYLTLERPTHTLSGGEFQRARLASALGSGLIGVCYILDEPTIGLHPRDTNRLIEILEELRDQGNSILVVEHDGELMRRADYLVDLGPGAGKEGGRVVAVGTASEVTNHADSLTGRYLREGSIVRKRDGERALQWEQSLTLRGARLHNLKNVSVRVPLGAFTCVTGVSGSGKSSLITETLIPAVRAAFAAASGPHSSLSTEFASIRSTGPFEQLAGAEHLDRIVEIDQTPLGRSGRSNPATYSGLWDEIRKVFAKTREARLRGYTARRFSFNAKQGRCEECGGRGTKRIDMRFMPDMHVACPRCKGARFNRQTLAVRFRGKNVADVLDMRIDEALTFFESFPKLKSVLQTFVDVGLGYLCLGQSSLTLSGGEAQRVKLATELSRGGKITENVAELPRVRAGTRNARILGNSAAAHGRTLFVLDEPTGGLHPADIERLIDLLERLVDQGHSVLVIEHQLDVIAAADWVIDLGPEGGEAGGIIVAEGAPAAIAHSATHTGKALREHWDHRASVPACSSG